MNCVLLFCFSFLAFCSISTFDGYRIYWNYNINYTANNTHTHTHTPNEMHFLSLNVIDFIRLNYIDIYARFSILMTTLINGIGIKSRTISICMQYYQLRCPPHYYRLKAQKVNMKKNFSSTIRLYSWKCAWFIIFRQHTENVAIKFPHAEEKKLKITKNIPKQAKQTKKIPQKHHAVRNTTVSRITKYTPRNFQFHSIIFLSTICRCSYGYHIEW